MRRPLDFGGSGSLFASSSKSLSCVAVMSMNESKFETRRSCSDTLQNILPLFLPGHP